ncbi:hypothetical protein BJ992_004373 [Sphaerisporangium rubeum]|uniref:IS4 family transposase n=1 Tax=Sphaerisporangium rubeum TaxID=321317 RepID=A0A7X0IJN9_9ACTN|nr:hypothetical protein [Sphaerisporangium rubeum]
MELVDEVLVECRRGERRVRVLPARVVVFFVLAMTLFPERGYAGVWRALCCSVRGVGVPSAAALRQARARLGEAPVRMLFDRLRGPVAPVATPGVWWRGLRLVAWDGSTLDLADEAAVRKEFGAPVHGSGREGAPQMAFALTIECGTRAVMDAVFGHCRTSESALVERMLGALAPGMLLLADRRFIGLGLWRSARQTGAHLLWRATATLAPTVIAHLPDGSYLAMRRGHKHERHLREMVRIIEATITVTLADGTTRHQTYKLMTTLLDHRTHPAADLVACYHQRWEIETALYGLKAIHKGSLRPLRSRTVPGIVQEFYALLLTHHLLRRLACHAALDTGLDPDQISFTTTLHTTRDTIITHTAPSPATPPRTGPTPSPCSPTGPCPQPDAQGPAHASKTVPKSATPSDKHTPTPNPKPPATPSPSAAP